MNKTGKLLSALMTAAMLSGAFSGVASAENATHLPPGSGDLNGKNTLTPSQMAEFNAKALRAAANHKLLLLEASGTWTGEDPVSLDQQQIDNRKALRAKARRPLLSLAPKGDWNGDDGNPYPSR
ncbi:hypothetical protein [Roseibium sp.]|uniref:hypothetical protein n=2 Tax=Roseibium sp. TaxID=1936156 RepID=UPI003D131A78